MRADRQTRWFEALSVSAVVLLAFFLTDSFDRVEDLHDRLGERIPSPTEVEIEKRPTHHLRERWNATDATASPFLVNLDGDPELEVIVSEGVRVRAYEPEGQIVWTAGPFQNAVRLDAVTITPAGVPAAYAVETRDSLHIVHEILHGEINDSGSYKVENTIHFQVLNISWDDRGARHLIAFAGGGHNVDRAFLSIDDSTRTFDWPPYTVGFQPTAFTSVRSNDVQAWLTSHCTNRNGNVGIGDGSNGGETDDERLYIVRVGEDGRQQLSTKLDGRDIQGCVDVEAYENETSRALIVFESHDPTFYRGPTRILLADWSTGRTICAVHVADDARWIGWTIKSSEDHTPIVRASTDQGFVYDVALCEGIQRSAGGLTEILGRMDADGDGRLDTIAGTPREARIVALNETLHPIAEYRTGVYAWKPAPRSQDTAQAATGENVLYLTRFGLAAIERVDGFATVETLTPAPAWQHGAREVVLWAPGVLILTVVLLVTAITTAKTAPADDEVKRWLKDLVPRRRKGGRPPPFT